jgi:hypothetical protein
MYCTATAVINSHSRVSCEAIPEEMSGLGTTPPAGESEEDRDVEASSHPQLSPCPSYPGAGVVQSPTRQATVTRTVPQSPTSVVSNGTCCPLRAHNTGEIVLVRVL